MEDYCIGTCKNSGVQFKYDIEDHERIAQHCWWSQPSGVYSHIDGRTVSLAKFILGIDEVQTKVLRRNKDAFDYRKANLFYKNIYRACGTTYEVECFDGQVFVIDKYLYNTVNRYAWHIDGNRYVITKLKSGRIIKLHRLLLGVVDDHTIEVDHINRDTLDNRLCNLRLANRSLNCYNRDVAAYNGSGKVGVYKMTGYDKWCAQINVNGKRKYLGSFDNFDDAVQARQRAEEIYYS